MTRYVLPALRAGDPFPPAERALPLGSPAPGLLAVGGALDVATLRAAYAGGIFPWYDQSAGENIMWWSTDPRMVLRPGHFRLHRSLRRAIARLRAAEGHEVRVDTAFDAVMLACARIPRPGQHGTWIGADMRRAYGALHRAGHAHSVEVWREGQLVAGLYCVAIGRAVFGESMFTHVTDGSRIALAALVALCLAQGAPLIDCQQNTAHLAFMGAAEIPRTQFLREIQPLTQQPDMRWHFEDSDWVALLPAAPEKT